MTSSVVAFLSIGLPSLICISGGNAIEENSLRIIYFVDYKDKIVKKKKEIRVRTSTFSKKKRARNFYFLAIISLQSIVYNILRLFSSMTFIYLFNSVCMRIYNEFCSLSRHFCENFCLMLKV